MKVDVTVSPDHGNGAAAFAIVVALIDALWASNKLSAADVQQILAAAEVHLPPDTHLVGREARKSLKSVSV
jgi:hypothetical protein